MSIFVHAVHSHQIDLSNHRQVHYYGLWTPSHLEINFMRGENQFLRVPAKGYTGINQRRSQAQRQGGVSKRSNIMNDNTQLVNTDNRIGE